jgi:hypothetical protein
MAHARFGALPSGEVTHSSWARGRTGAFPSDGAGKVLSDTWLLRSPPWVGNGTQSHGTCVGTSLYALFLGYLVCWVRTHEIKIRVLHKV